MALSDQDVLGICHRMVDAVEGALSVVEDWAPLGSRPGQYAIDLTADAAALAVLNEAGLGILSEESGLTRPGSDLMAVIDPVDGSTNASRRVPWYASSVCVLDGAGPWVAVVANLATGARYHAVRGAGAFRDGTAIGPSACRHLRSAVIGLSGYPARHLGWAQFRAFGAAALDLCSVAEGTLDAFTVGGRAHLGPWDYLGGLLVCHEAGAFVTDLEGAELVTTEPHVRRAVAAAATQELLAEVVAAAGAAAAR